MKVEKELSEGLRVSVTVELLGGGDGAKAGGVTGGGGAGVVRRSVGVPVADAPPLSETPELAALAEGLPSLREVQRRYVAQVINASGGNMTRAAEVLRVQRRTLYRMAERFGLTPRG